MAPGSTPLPPYVAVKVPVFSFEKLTNVDTHLGPEMKSTGEVLGLADTLDEALYKGLLAAGYRLERQGGRAFHRPGQRQGGDGGRGPEIP